MSEFVLLFGIVGIAVFIAILIRVGKSSREFELLKLRLSSLERQIRELKGPAAKEAPKDEQVKRQPVQPEIKEEVIVSGPRPIQAQPVASEKVPEPAAVSKAATPGPTTFEKPKPAEPQVSRVAEFLRSIGLWPPDRTEGSSELVLMQWWMPRIGGGLAILAIIFFAVYVAQGTAPWVKFAEMLVASVSVFGLGIFFTRKRPGLGNVLVATGLSMIYITSVAGYAVGPVKIVDNPILGALMQIAALVLNFGMGTWKKERGILILAIVFGYVSSLFAALEGFREAALISSLLIYLAGLFSYRKIGGLTLSSLALAGVYLPLAGFIGIEFIKDAAVYPAFWSVIVFLVITVSILPACKRWILDPPFLESKWNRLFQSLNTSLAVGLGYLFVAHFYSLGKTEFYGVLALVFIAWSLVWFLRDLKGIEFHLFFLKGSALASLWFINHYHGDLRWMALAVQVVILAASVHRSKSVWVEAISLVTWLVSFRYFVPEMVHGIHAWSFLWFMQAVYILVSIGGLGYLMAYNKTAQIVLRRVVYAIPGLMLAIAAIVFAAESKVFGLDETATIAIMALLSLATVAIPGVRSWVPSLVGGIVFIWAHVLFWIEPTDDLISLVVVLGVTGICLKGLFKAKLQNHNFVETSLHVLWVLTVARFLGDFESLSIYPIVIAAFSVALFFGGFYPLKRLSEVCALPLLTLALVDPRVNSYPGFVLLVFCALVGFLANAGVIWPRLQEFVHYQKRGNFFWWVLNLLFFFWTYWAMEDSLSLTNQLLVWVFLGATYFAFWYWRGQAVSLVGALVFAAIPILRIVDLWINPITGGLLEGAPWAGQVLLAGFSSMLLWIGFGAYSKIRAHESLSEKSHDILAWASGLLAFVVYASALAYPLLNWERVYTPMLAGFSIGLIILGIVLKSRPYRYVAMLTFLVPLIRLFVYDIRETLYRIIAFAVLAVVLTAVGFLYQKYSSRIE
jgi:hypothetical protein